MLAAVLAFVGPPKPFGENEIGPEIFQTPCVFGSGDGCFNRASLLMVLAALVTIVLFIVAFRRPKLVPRGLQNLMESIVEFIRNGIVLEVIGREGLAYLPFLTAMFVFIFVSNVFGILPFVNFPATSRMAIPLFLAVLVWFIFNIAGIRAQGLRYFKNALFPPSVPWPLYFLVTPIEFVSTFLVRPFSLSVRLLGNMFAGHLILTIFALGTLYLGQHVAQVGLLTKLVGVFSLPAFALLVFLTGFEILVAVLQAYIFTILTAVYVGGAIHPEH
ncbi:MAG TPA: F0F1 ATP synthase subunit A [Actinomycetota bacterium]|nr:F0F1 ATP synthase subunit A [Actinomycetota bacterium]